MIVIRPGIIEFNLASLAAIGTGICYAFYLIVTRKLKNKDNGFLTLLTTSFVGTIILSLFIPFIWISPTYNEYILGFIMGFIAALAHGMIIISYNYAEASKLAPLGYFEIITNIFISYILFSNLPDNFTFLGLSIIIISGVYVFKRENNLSKIY